jgi:CheY-like chemotaxis protein
MMDERPFEGWFCREGDKVIGPLGRARLRQLAREGRLQPEQTVWEQQLPEGELIAPVCAGEVLRTDRFAALVVDDDMAAAEALARLLREAGADHCVICTGEEAARATSALEPEAVFIDLELPCLAGYALASALRQLPSPPRVVALTGEEMAPGRKGPRPAGFRHWLAKPADPERLREILTHLGRPVPAKAG